MEKEYQIRAVGPFGSLMRKESHRDRERKRRRRQKIAGLVLLVLWVALVLIH
jgi:hypothetical protein